MNDYPTDEQLKKIRKWSHNDFKGMFYFINNIWNKDYGYSLIYSDQFFQLYTGGWSGNEDILRAMSENIAWWASYWQSSHRGGKYVFVKLKQKEKL